MTQLQNRALVVVPAAAFVAILSLFLPIASVSAFGFSMSANFFSEEAGGEGWILLFLFLIVIAFAVVAILLRRTWARIATAVMGILFGLVGAIDGFGTMIRIGDSPGVSLGAGAVLLAIASAVLIGASIAVAFRRKARLSDIQALPVPDSRGTL